MFQILKICMFLLQDIFISTLAQEFVTQVSEPKLMQAGCELYAHMCIIVSSLFLQLVHGSGCIIPSPVLSQSIWGESVYPSREIMGKYWQTISFRMS